MNPRNVSGQAVEKCSNCRRWTFAGSSCCVPCENGPGRHPHQWLCETRERERFFRPREEHGPESICPACDRGLLRYLLTDDDKDVFVCTRCDGTVRRPA
ncbi:hypothetical protein [Streptomyces sp. HNM0574]|uniref:hypothetical protein n=1 Tax=Streptomyces sp. HNM0574 TaxID=2714954 RepID=UPI00146F8174|nr:hypothetical protein [Streptomyces sp. HNM0574]NLU67745.1 hypothetical protein [Streptomyces sp. HNM0574]